MISTNQTHVMSLAVTAQGDLIAGTDPEGGSADIFRRKGLRFV